MIAWRVRCLRMSTSFSSSRPAGTRPMSLLLLLGVLRQDGDFPTRLLRLAPVLRLARDNDGPGHGLVLAGRVAAESRQAFRDMPRVRYAGHFHPTSRVRREAAAYAAAARPKTASYTPNGERLYLVVEDDAVRVLEVIVDPGERENLHHYRWPRKSWLFSLDRTMSTAMRRET